MVTLSSSKIHPQNTQKPIGIFVIKANNSNNIGYAVLGDILVLHLKRLLPIPWAVHTQPSACCTNRDTQYTNTAALSSVYCGIYDSTIN